MEFAGRLSGCVFDEHAARAVLLRDPGRVQSERLGQELRRSAQHGVAVEQNREMRQFAIQARQLLNREVDLAA